MAVPQARRSARRQPARPLPGATWQAHVLDATAISTELNRLWSRIGSGSAAGDHPADVARRSGGVLTRASTLNLTAVARSRAAARRIEEAVTHLSELYPSRATILVADPERPSGGDAGFDVRAALLEHDAGKDRPSLLFECVTVEVGADAERHLASIASPLLVFDLPDFLWWAGESVADSKLFDDLIEVNDRLIVDSASFADPAIELRHLASLIRQTEGCPNLSDFAWARLTPWRQVVTQFFDPPSTMDALDSLDAVELSYGGDGGSGDGLTAALLLAGWLGSRLGWRPPGELLPVRGAPGAWRATLRVGAVGREREVLLTLRPTDAPAAAASLGSVSLKSLDGAAGSFRAERVDNMGLATVSDLPDLPAAQRHIYAAVKDDGDLLTEELRIFGRDPAYEAALSFAATLAPATTRQKAAA
ncbi:MAG: glucose-6-phosphate dehydrogenase assembly protein OpcA [Chloroflexota bacterium]|nr:glucose-6-phosphate dehydrogenase assembly protein OpcA [Chloroflexota bacterium]